MRTKAKNRETSQRFRRAHPDYYRTLERRRSALEANRKSNSRWYATEEGKFSAWSRNLRKFGITSKVYAEILRAQNGVCFICGKGHSGEHRNGRTVRFNVDHNHATGLVRGLLCGACNKMIGFAAENPETLRAAAWYIENIAKARVLRTA